MTTYTTKFEIIEGPSADRVFDTLKFAYGDFKLTARFRIRRVGSNLRGSLSGYPVDAQIIGVQYESGSSGIFTLTVNIPGYFTSTGCYNANTRKGFFELQPH